jgi:ankyrin repeat protein/beta-lactamase regulating signal transducer with metallopeptidase domain
MSVILEQINSVGYRFVEFAIPMLVQSSLLILILLFVDLLMRKKVKAGFRYWIWTLVLVKLILPTSLSTPASLGRWFGEELAVVDVDQILMPRSTTEFALDRYLPLATPMKPSIESSSPASKPAISPVVSMARITWQGIVFLAWLVVVVIMALLLLQRTLFVRRLVAQAKKVDDFMNDTLARCCYSMGIRRKVELRISMKTASPAVCRLFRPVILLPQNLLPSLDVSQLRAILMHELAHLKRFDLWINFAQTFLQIVYFYNPLLWLANAIIRRAREQAVDEAVLVAMGEKAQEYLETLVNVAKLAFRGPTLSLRLIGVVESKNLFEWRIRTMLSKPIPKSSKLGALGIIVIIIIAAVLLPMARAQKVDVSGTVASTNEGRASKSLHQAAADGDIEQVKLLISKGANVNERDSWGKTPLHYACEKGYTEVVELLISRGAAVNTVSSERRMSPDWRKPLDYAAMGGHKQTVELLISKGADIDGQSEGGRRLWFEAMRSPAGGKEVVQLLVARGAEIPELHLAAYMGDMEKLKKLLQEGENVNVPATYGFTALHAAVNGGNKDVVEFLISKGAKVDARDTFRLTPLYYAALHSYEDIGDLLLDKGSDINADDGGWTLLYDAILYDYYGDKGKDAIKLLISKGANVNIKDSAGCTPLHYAIWMGYGDIVETLINNGADVNAEDNDGFTPYCCAVMRGRKDFVELLIAKGATPVSTIHWAACAGDLEKVKAFIEEGTDIDAKDKSGETPLFSAVRADNSDVAKFLIAKGANVNAKDSSGNTPLHFAPERAKNDVVELLIAKGADINAKSNNGETPLHDAIYFGRRKIAELFIAKGADVNAKHTHHSISGITPLYIACSRCRKEVAEALVAKGADVNTKDSNGQTPLHLACVRGHKDIAQLLIAKDADINARDNKEKTPLSLAKEQGHDEIVRLLVKHGAME